MNRYTYKTNETTVTDEKGISRKAYGICAYVNDSTAPTTKVNGVFGDLTKATAFAKLCTEIQLCPDQLDDVIADFFTWIDECTSRC